jgi:hypothetical protein
MLRNDIRNIAVVICEINAMMTSTKPQGTFFSIICLLAASRYLGNDDRNQMKWQSRMDMDIVSLLKKSILLSKSFNMCSKAFRSGHQPICFI